STTNVLWPLPGSRYRWTFQLLRSESEFPEKERRAARFADQSTDEDIRHWMQKMADRRAPWFSGGIKEVIWFTQGAFPRRLAKQSGKERCWLAGDAAHQTGPVGMQSMNVGLHEAVALAGKIKKVLRDKARLDELAAYDREQQEEWRRLLGVGGELKARADASA